MLANYSAGREIAAHRVTWLPQQQSCNRLHHACCATRKAFRNSRCAAGLNGQQPHTSQESFIDAEKIIREAEQESKNFVFRDVDDAEDVPNSIWNTFNERMAAQAAAAAAGSQSDAREPPATTIEGADSAANAYENMQELSVADVQAAPHLMILDVRTPEEFGAGHAPGAVNVPLDKLTECIGEVPRDRQIAVICQSGRRSAQAVVKLVRVHKFDAAGVANVKGGTLAWIAAGYEMET